jgi:hypothetical protein
MLGFSGESIFKPKSIIGSGNIHHKKMWLNVRDVRGTVRHDAWECQRCVSEGLLRVAINEWKDYVSVR